MASGKDRLQKGRAAAPFEAVPSRARTRRRGGGGPARGPFGGGPAGRNTTPPGGGPPAGLAEWQAYSTVWTVSNVHTLLAVSAVLI